MEIIYTFYGILCIYIYILLWYLCYHYYGYLLGFFSLLFVFCIYKYIDYIGFCINVLFIWHIKKKTGIRDYISKNLLYWKYSRESTFLLLVREFRIYGAVSMEELDPEIFLHIKISFYCTELLEEAWASHRKKCLATALHIHVCIISIWIIFWLDFS